MTAPVLAFDNVALVLGGTRLFEAVDFTVAHAQRVAIVADSGRGKTVVARLALGFALPSAGSVTLLGTSVGALPAAEQRRVRARCGLALQGGSLLEALSVEDNLTLAFGGASRGAARALRRRLDRLLVDFRIEHLAPTQANALSTGEKRRVELARAFVRDPDLVILDEPFEGAAGQAVALEAQVRRHVVGRQRALLLLTQDAALARRLADRCYRLHQGALQQLDEDSTPPAASPANFAVA